MSWFDKLLGLSEPAPRVFTAPTAWPDVVPSVRGIRKGMWARLPDGRVGIVAGFVDAATADFHLVDEHGATAACVRPPLADLRIAAWADIPSPRRPDPETAAGFGYL